MLAEHFGQAGSVTSARIVRKRDTGQSQGFGFVEFESAEEASAAIERLHTSQLDGRELQVRWAGGPRPASKGPLPAAGHAAAALRHGRSGCLPRGGLLPAANLQGLTPALAALAGLQGGPRRQAAGARPGPGRAA